MEVTVMSFNVNHFAARNSEISYDAYADTVRVCGGDIIVLNEVFDGKPEEGLEKQAKQLADRLGFYFYFAKATTIEWGGDYGNALVSRYPIVSAEIIPIPDPVAPAYDGYYETRCLLKAQIDVGGGLTVLGTHFGLNPDEQAAAVATIVDNLPTERTVLMGDFNVTPDSALLTPIRERLFDTADLFEEPLYSWSSENPDRKIDYIFTTRDVTVTEADIPAWIISDHFPHTAVLEL